MAVNASFTGRTYPATAPYAVGREKIREFAEAVGADDVIHTDQIQARARGYRDVIAPPTFAVLIAQQCDRQLIVDPEAGIDFSRVVHGEQRFVHHRPITVFVRRFCWLQSQKYNLLKCEVMFFLETI